MATLGEEMHQDTNSITSHSHLSWSSPRSLFSNTRLSDGAGNGDANEDGLPDADEVRGQQASRPLFFRRHCHFHNMHAYRIGVCECFSDVWINLGGGDRCLAQTLVQGAWTPY